MTQGDGVPESLLMYLQWKPVRITEKRHFLTGVGIMSYGLASDSHSFQLRNGIVHALNTKSQMP